MIRPVSADGRIETGGVFTPVERPRVVERIAAAAAQRITLIVAPAGYGKSTALRQYLGAIGGPNIQYGVRPEHSTLLGFLRGFADALVGVAPDARKTIAGAFERNQTSKTAGADLAMWMHAHLKTFAGLIVIDDLHFAENDPQVSHFLASLIEKTKGRTKWIIASRSTLELPVGTWLAYGDMDLTIDEQDLRFDLSEARQAAKTARVGVREEELAELLSMTEGWPTALTFALRSSTRSVDLRNVAASTREMIYSYLAEQVYKSLSKAEKKLLHFTAYLDEIDLGTLRAAGYDSAKAVIESLRERVAFVYADRPGVYRCHDLFRTFLQHELELQGDAIVEKTRHRLARALEETRNIAAALDLYARTSSPADVLRLLELHGFELMERGHGDIVQSAVGALPPDVRATNPVVLAVRGLHEADTGRLDRAESLLERAIAQAPDSKMKAEISIRLALIRANQMRDITSLLEPLLNEGLAPSLLGEVMSLLAVAYAYAGRAHDASEVVGFAEKAAREIEGDQERAKILHRVGIAVSRLGVEPDKAFDAQNRAASLASDLGLFSLASRAFSALASIMLFYKGDSLKEIWYAQQAANASMKAGDRFDTQTAILQLIDAEGRRGNAERLRALEEQLAAVSTSDLNRLVYVVPARAFAAAWDGRFDEAQRLMATVAGNGRFFDFDRTLNAAAHSLFLLADNQRERALALVGQNLEEIETMRSALPHGRRQNEIARLLCAGVEALAGRQTKAQRILQKRCEDHEPVVQALREAIVTICRVAKNPLLLGDLAERLEALSTVGYGGLARVLERAVEHCVDSEAHTRVDLTRAQIEILEALARGQTPKEIAQETGRSVYTVQVHIQNIIKRLGCRGRSEAIMTARRRGLLAQ